METMRALYFVTTFEQEDGSNSRLYVKSGHYYPGMVSDPSESYLTIDEIRDMVGCRVRDFPDHFWTTI